MCVCDWWAGERSFGLPKHLNFAFRSSSSRFLLSSYRPFVAVTCFYCWETLSIGGRVKVRMVLVTLPRVIRYISSQ